MEPAPESEPEVGSGLARFHAALESLQRGQRKKVRVLHFGDSHTAADLLTTAIRRNLQARYGNGGRGFVLLGHPWKSYDPKDIFVSSTGKWVGKRTVFGDEASLRDGRFGLSGIASEPVDTGAVSKIAAPTEPPFSAPIERLELWYLAQPKGGEIVLTIDARQPVRLSTESDDFTTGVKEVHIGPGAHMVSISAAGTGPVRVFGAVVESDSRGVVYDTLGVNGAFFDTVLSWDESLLSQQVSMRDPSLVVIMYGTNDAGERTLAPETFAQTVAQAIAKLLRGAPAAACLVVGPPDSRSTVRRPVSAARLDWVISVEADVAKAHGCAFIDARALMGGSGSFSTWQKQGLAAADGVHLTPKGYATLGHMIAAQMMPVAIDANTSGSARKQRSKR